MKKKIGSLLIAFMMVMTMVPSLAFAGETAARGDQLVEDITGPTITDFSIEENGKTLTVGDTFHVTAKWEDMSGVNDVTAFWDGPGSGSGGIFTFTFNEEKQLWECEYTFTADDVSGEYYVSSIWAYDKWGNRSESYYPEDKINFVGGGSDSTGPTMTEFCIEENGKTLTVGDTFHVTAKWEDMSGVNDVTAFWDGPGSGSGGIFTFTFNEEKQLWECEYTFTADDASGEYYVSSIWAYDEQGNRSESYYPEDKINFVGGISDIIGPTITEFCIEENGQILTVGDTFHVTAKWEDMSGVNDVTAFWDGPGSGSGGIFTFTFNEETQLWECEYTLTEEDMSGKYYVSSIWAYDKWGNRSDSYYPEEQIFFEKNGHSLIEHPAKEATCTEPGWTAYKTCEYCNYTTGKEILDPLGHNYGTYKTTRKAKFGNSGVQKATCATCKEPTTESIAAPKTIKLSYDAYAYDGKVRKPTVKAVYDTNGNKISSANYKISYASGRKNVGKYKVTVTFNKNSADYTGKIDTTFKVNPKGTSISKLTAAKKGFTVKWKKQSSKMAKSRITGYQVRYSTSSKMTKPKTVTIKGYSKTSKKISKLKAKKKYYVQVRTYKTVSGTKYYSSWSKAKAVTTK